MNPRIEKLLLQIMVSLACLVPVSAGFMGALLGPGWLRGVGVPVAIDLDSHFRYLSGLLLAIGLGFASCVAGIEDKGERFRWLGLLVVVGGLARLGGLIAMGEPSAGHMFGLVMELVVVPALMLWQAGFAKRFRHRL